MSLVSRKWWASSAQFRPNFQNWMKKAPFGYSPRPSRTLRNANYNITLSNKFWFNGKILLQKMLLGSMPKSCNNFHIFSLEDKVVFKGEGMLGFDPNHLLYNVIRL